MVDKGKVRKTFVKIIITKNCRDEQDILIKTFDLNQQPPNISSLQKVHNQQPLNWLIKDHLFFIENLL